MRITVLTRRWARPGREAALVAASRELIEPVGPQREALDRSEIFQGLTDPCQTLYLATWQSREAYLEHRAHGCIDMRLDPLCRGEAARYFLRRWVVYENPQARATTVDCVLLQSPPDQREVLWAFLLRESGPKIRTQPGFCYRRIYQNLDHPDHVVVVRGWESPAAWERFRDEVEPSINLAGHFIGAATEHFIGLVQREFGTPSAGEA